MKGWTKNKKEAQEMLPSDKQRKSKAFLNVKGIT